MTDKDSFVLFLKNLCSFLSHKFICLLPLLTLCLFPQQEAPDVVCAAIGLCQTEQAALAKLQVNEQLTSNDIPLVDLSQPVAPFILNVPQLLYPQEDPKQEAPQQETPKTVQVSFAPGKINVFYSYFGSDWTSSLSTRQENGDVCEDCIKFLTDAQAEAKANSSFVDSLIANIENQCDLLGPSISSLVRAQTG